jgi:hypothetical protein
MTMDADMDTGTTMTTTMTTTTTTSTLMLVTRIHPITMLITQTSTGLVYLAVTMPVTMSTRIQIRIPSIPSITVSTVVLIVAIAMPLWHLHSRIPIHSPIIMSDKRVNLRIPTRMCMCILTSHILIHALHLLMKRKANMVRSLPQSGNESPILVVHHFKLHLETTNHPQHR